MRPSKWPLTLLLGVELYESAVLLLSSLLLMGGRQARFRGGGGGAREERSMVNEVAYEVDKKSSRGLGSGM